MAGAAAGTAPLLVPLADVTAKNLRASLHKRRPSTFDSAGELKRGVSLLDSLAPTPGRAGASGEPKFSRLADDAPSLVRRARAALARWRATTRAPRAPPRRKDTAPGAGSALQKAARALARLCDALSALPSPLIAFLSSVLVTVLLRAWLPSTLASLPSAASHALDGFTVLSAFLSLLYRRGGVFRALAAGVSPYSHPVDSCLEAYADSLTAREAAVSAGNDELRTHRAKLDALRRELARDPAASDPSAVLKPSRRAAAMIAAGALGAGFDAEKAAEAERLRRDENLRRSREQWRERGELTTGDADEFSLQQLQSHAATGYRKHTKELKLRSAPHPPRNAPSLAVLRKAAVVGHIAAAVVRREGSGSSTGAVKREGSGSGSGAPAFGSFNSLTAQSGAETPARGRTWLGGGGGVTTPRRYSGASEASVRTAASEPASRHNTKRKKMHLFRRKRAHARGEGAPPTPVETQPDAQGSAVQRELSLSPDS